MLKTVHDWMLENFFTDEEGTSSNRTHKYCEHYEQSIWENYKVFLQKKKNFKGISN